MLAKGDMCSDLEIRKPVERGEVDLLLGSGYYEVLLPPLEQSKGNPGEPVGVKTPPRLELLAAVLGLILARKVSELL